VLIRAARVSKRSLFDDRTPSHSSADPSLTVGALIRRTCFQHSLEHAIALGLIHKDGGCPYHGMTRIPDE